MTKKRSILFHISISKWFKLRLNHSLNYSFYLTCYSLLFSSIHFVYEHIRYVICKLVHNMLNSSTIRNLFKCFLDFFGLMANLLSKCDNSIDDTVLRKMLIEKTVKLQRTCWSRRPYFAIKGRMLRSHNEIEYVNS